jgi:SAM-dependent methyltransferase
VRPFYDPELYDARAVGVPGDVAFFADLAQDAARKDLPVLELACGTGRVAIPVARQGVRVVGLDASEAMLTRAREKSAGMGMVRWVHGNMASFQLAERFGLIYVPARSFLHLLTVEDQLSCLASVHEHLVPGGRFALDIFNPSIPMIAEWLGPKRGSIAQRVEDYTHPATGRRTKAWETRVYRVAEQLNEVAFIDEQVDDDGVVVSRTYSEFTLRFIYRFEMEHLLARAGFEIEALYGDCEGSELTDASPELVFVARRPG